MKRIHYLFILLGILLCVSAALRLTIYSPDGMMPSRGEESSSAAEKALVIDYQNQLTLTGPLPAIAGHSIEERLLTDSYVAYGNQESPFHERILTLLNMTVPVWKGEQEDSPERIQMLENLIADGCEDPLVLYLYTFSKTTHSDRERKTLFVACANALAKSSYPAFHKCKTFVRAADYLVDLEGFESQKDRRLAERLLVAYAQLFPQVAADPDLGGDALYYGCERYMRVYNEVFGSFQSGFTILDQILRENLPENDHAHELVKGKYCWDAAWQVRGGGFANTISEENGQTFEAYMHHARLAFTAAWKMDTNSVVAPTKMIRVAGSDCGDGDIDIWFERAIQNNPNNSDAYEDRMFHYTPRWGGSAEELVAFGKRCYATERWDAGIPQLLVLAHVYAGGYSSTYVDNPSYFMQPGVWEDVQMVYTNHLARYPNDAWHRTRYARLAWLCRQWKTAKEQIDILGKHIDMEEFGGRKNYKKALSQLENIHQRKSLPNGPSANHEVAMMIYNGDFAAFTNWVSTSGHVDACDETGISLLSLAVGSEQPFMAHWLLRNGASPKETNANQPLLNKAIADYEQDLTEMLIIKGANIDAKNTSNGDNPLTYSVYYNQPEVTRMLIKAGANLEIKNHFGDSPLGTAASRSATEIIPILVEAGANLESRNRFQYTPLMSAAAENQPASVQLLLELGAQVDATTSANTTPLLIAAYHGYADILDILLKHGANVDIIYKKDGRTALISATKGGHVEAVRVLLRHGANTNLKDNAGKRAREIANEKGFTDIIELLNQDS